MKYSVNHHWKFYSYKSAFIVGLSQCIMATIVEFSTCLILIFQSNDIFLVLANYIIVIVISEFDENFYAINSDARNKRKIYDEKYEDLRKIEVSTSWSADHRVEGNRLAPENILSPEEANQRPEYNYISFSSRSCGNKCLYIIFRIFKFGENSIWYYFWPFLFRYSWYFLFIYENEHLEKGGEAKAEGGGHLI